MSAGDVPSGLYVLGGTVLGGVIASGTAFLEERWARSREAKARRAARFEARSDFQRGALLALQDAIPGLIHAIAMVEEEREGSLQKVHLVTWQFHALRHKIENLRVLEAAQILADAVADVTEDGASPQRVQAVVDGANDLLAVIGNVLPLL
jgi:hypothetical protein